VEFRLLGPVQAWRLGRPVDLGSDKQRFLLALLLLEANRPVELTRLVELIWPEGGPPSAVSTLYTLAWRLRRVLADAGAERYGVRLLTAGRGYLLRTPAERIDATRFRLLVERAREVTDDRERVTLLRQALALWRGPALAGAAPPQVRERLCRSLEEARLAAVEDRFDAELRLGHHHAVLEELAELAGQHRLRERLVAQHVLALYRCGRTVDALTAYRSATRYLAEEFGLDPGPQLRRLELGILRGEAGGQPAVPAVPVTTGGAAGHGRSRVVRVSSFDEIAAEFRARVARIGWATLATVAPDGAPRTRVLLPLWEGPVGWIVTGRDSPKIRHLQHEPRISLAYWDPEQETVLVEAVATVVDERAVTDRVWDLFAAAPPPAGYDPGRYWSGGKADPDYGLLRLDPTRIALSSRRTGGARQPAVVYRPARRWGRPAGAFG
jgi:ABC-2 type transport system ATP-binding protein